jgi:hypothetical protein
MLTGILPDLSVKRSIQTNLRDVYRIGIGVLETINKARRQVLIEEKPHSCPTRT